MGPSAYGLLLVAGFGVQRGCTVPSKDARKGLRLQGRVRMLTPMAIELPASHAGVSQTAVWALNEARRIVGEELRGQRARVILFGSWARGTADRLSDIDVGIWPDDDLPGSLLVRLRERFEESNIPFHVDVVDLREMDESLRNRVLAEGIPWSV